MLVFYFLVLVGIVALVGYRLRRPTPPQGRGNSEQMEGYPYRPDVEERLPDGTITTHGYAAHHPAQFAHWKYGPNNVYGESIERHDWEEWRHNYYG